AMNLREEVEQIINEKDYTPMTVSEFQDVMGLSNADSFKELIKVLVDLEQTGQLERTETDRYKKKRDKSDLVIGKLSQHKKGFAFLRPQDDTIEDIFIPQNQINKAMDGDEVLVEVVRSRGDQKGKNEGIVKAITTRNITEVVGTYTEAKHFGFVLPDHKRITQDIFIPKGKNLGAVDGH